MKTFMNGETAMRSFFVTIILSISLLSINTPIKADILPEGGEDLLAQQMMNNIKSHLMDSRIDGWFFTGHGSFNDIHKEFLGLEGKTSQRWIIFISGIASYKKPLLIYHKDDMKVFEKYNFYPFEYKNLLQLRYYLQNDIKAIANDVMANYSSQLSIPELSQTDAGFMELLAKYGFRVKSSGSLLSFLHTRWLKSEMASHQKAADLAAEVPEKVRAYLSDKLLSGSSLTDYELSRQLEKIIKSIGLESVSEPVVAASGMTIENSYVPRKSNRLQINKNEVMYIEICVKNSDRPRGLFELLRGGLDPEEDNPTTNMYTRLGWTFYTAETAPEKITKSWNVLYESARSSFDLIKEDVVRGKEVAGNQVDERARSMLLKESPRTMARPLGRNINADNRMFGVNLDNYMASDNRIIFPGMGFTLEPGITVENEYQLRLCNNVYIDGERVAHLSVPLQEHIYTLSK